jgi:3',5'-cyclic-AMP phosphodiesterase
MPIVLDRRSFLAAGPATAAALLIRRAAGAPASGARIALLSDTHIAGDPNDRFRGFSPHENLRKAVAQVSASKFDLVIVNGDLARQKGEPADYAAFNGLMDPLFTATPAALTMGNHDDRKLAIAALTKRAGTDARVNGKLVTTLDAGGLKLVFLDSLLATNIAPGQLGKAQREWLGGYLDGLGGGPVTVFVHHNPDPDNDGALVDAERLLQILEPRRSVKALFFGHTHVPSVEQRRGLHLVNLPAVGYNFADGIPIGWVESSFTTQGAELQLHALGGEMKDNGRSWSLAWR